MSSKALAFLATRLMALWLFVTAATSVSGVAVDWGDGPAPPYWLAIVLMLVVAPVACGAVLWLYADRAAGYIVRGLPESPSENRVEANTLHAIGVSLLGLWLVVHALPDVAQVTTLKAAMLFARPPDLPADEALDYRIWVYAQAGTARFAGLLLELLVGLLLCLRPQAVVQFVHRATTRLPERHQATAGEGER